MNFFFLHKYILITLRLFWANFEPDMIHEESNNLQIFLYPLSSCKHVLEKTYLSYSYLLR